MSNTSSNNGIDILKKHEDYIINQINKTKNASTIKNLELHLEKIREKIQDKENHELKKEKERKSVLITKAEDAGALLKSAS